MPSANIFHPPLFNGDEKVIHWGNLHGASVSLALANAIADNKQPLLIIAPDNLYVSHLLEKLKFFNAKLLNLISFPDYETLPYDHFSPHQDIISERLTALNRIPTLQQGAIVSTIATLMQRLSPKEYLDSHSFLL